MYNLLEYSDNHFMKSGSLWNYYRDKANRNGNNYGIDNSEAISKSCKYNTKIIGSAPANTNRLGT